MEKLRIHSALSLANAMFGLGSIVGALGLPATNPLTFTFVREVISGFLLLSLSSFVLAVDTTNEKGGSRNGNGNGHYDYSHLLLPQAAHVRGFAILGTLLFIDNAAYIVGIQLAGPVTGSVWQPSAPILTACISMVWGWEQWSFCRLTGVLVAFGGCAAMILLSEKQRQHDQIHGGTTSFLIGNLFFLCNCLATSFFILLSKSLLSIYPSLMVIAWSNNLASVGMFLAALVSSVWEPMEHFICPTCSSTNNNNNMGMMLFHIPRETLPALAYYVLAMTVGSWGLIVWCNQYATGTLVVGYSVLQPVTSMFFTSLLLLLHWVAPCFDHDDDDVADGSTGSTALCLNEPGVGTLCGMLGVACGLALVIQTEPIPPTMTAKMTTTMSMSPVKDIPITSNGDDGSTFEALADYRTMML